MKNIMGLVLAFLLPSLLFAATSPPLYQFTTPLSISNGTVSMTPASTIASGYLTTGVQSLAGAKTWTGAAQFDAAVNGNISFTAPFFASSTSGVATSGTFRLINTGAINWMNAAGNGNIPLSVNASNQLTFNGTPITSSTGIVPPSAGGTGVANNDAATLTRSGNHALTITTTGTTGVTLPTTGTLSTLAGSETLTNKTLTSPTINAGALSGSFSGTPTFTGLGTFTAGLTTNLLTLSGGSTPTLSALSTDVMFSGGIRLAGDSAAQIVYTGGGIYAAPGYSAPDGSTSLPSYRFATDTNSGVYYSGSAVRFVFNGVEQYQYYADGLLMSAGAQLMLDPGTVSETGLACAYNDLNCGLYQVAADSLGFAASGLRVGYYGAAGNWGLGVGTGSNLSTTTILTVGGTGMTGTDQAGIYLAPNFRSSATAGMTGISVAPSSEAASYTTPYYLGVFSQDITKGAGNTITRYINFYAGTSTAGTNNASIADNLSFTGNWFINSTRAANSIIGGALSVSGQSATNISSSATDIILTGNLRIGCGGCVQLSSSDSTRIVTSGTFRYTNLTASTATYLDSNKDFASSTTTNTQLALLDIASGRTGTANLVYSASPTLTGTIVAAAAGFSGTVNFTGTPQVRAGGGLYWYRTDDAAAVSLAAGATATNQNYVLPLAYPTVNGQFLTATTAGAMSWSTNTGTTGTVTSNLVYSASPTFSGTVTMPAGSWSSSAVSFGSATLATSGIVTLTNATAGSQGAGALVVTGGIYSGNRIQLGANSGTGGAVGIGNNTGITWRNQANDANLEFYVNTSNVFVMPTPITVTGTGTFSGQVLGAVGSDGAPSFSISTDTNSGVKLPGGDVVELVTAGASRLYVSAAQIALQTQGRWENGTVGAPSWAYSSDVDTGMYRVADGSQGITANGVLVASHSATGAWCFGPSCTAQTDTTMNINGIAPITGAAMAGLRINPTAAAGATSGGVSLSVEGTTANSSFTMPYYLKTFIQPLTKGAASTVTRLIGIYGTDDTAGTNNAFFANNLSFTGNWFINYSGSAASTIGGVVTFSGATVNTNTLQVKNNQGLYLYRAGDAAAVGFLVDAASTNQTYTLPAAYPTTAGKFLTSTSGAGTMSWSTALLGVTDASSAAAGYVGEVVECNTLDSAAVTLTDDDYTNICTMSLSAGDWLVSGEVTLVLNGAGTPAECYGVVLNKSNGNMTGAIQGKTTFTDDCSNLSGTEVSSIAIKPYRFSSSSSDTMYIKARFNAGSGSPQGYGSGIAWRIR